MMEDQVKAYVKVKPYFGKEEPIPPMKKPLPQRTISFKLEPIQPKKYVPDEVKVQEALTNLTVKPTWDRQMPVLPTLVTKGVVINIETSGLDPEKDKIAVIGAKDVRDSTNEVMIFSYDDEEKILLEFMKWYTDNGFNEVIGWNVDFDYAFLLRKCMKYRIPARELFVSNVYDLMNVLRTGKEKYQYSNNPKKRLNNMLFDMFGMERPIEDVEAMKHFAAGNRQPFIELDKYHVFGTWLLYVLWKATIENSFASSGMNTATIGEGEESEYMYVQCKECLAENKIQKGVKEFKCKVCDAVNQITA